MDLRRWKVHKPRDGPDSAPIPGLGRASGSPLHPLRERGTVVASHSRGVHTSMLGIIGRFARQARQPALATATVAIMLPALIAPSLARGPEAIADVAEQVIDAVVNISTSQNVGGRGAQQQQAPNDPKVDELFRDLFGPPRQGRAEGRARAAAPRQLARFRFHHRRDRHRGHQQPRHRRGRRDHRHPQRRHPRQSGADGPRSEDRYRAVADQDRQAAEGGPVRRLRQAAAG